MHKAPTSLCHNFINVLVFIHNKKSCADAVRMGQVKWKKYCRKLEELVCFCVCFGEGVDRKHTIGMLMKLSKSLNNPLHAIHHSVIEICNLRSPITVHSQDFLRSLSLCAVIN